MSTITLKTATRDTQVSRFEVRAAIAKVYAKKTTGQLPDRKAHDRTGKSGNIRSVKATGK